MIRFELVADAVEGSLEFDCYPRLVRLLVAVGLQLSDLNPQVLCAVPGI